MSVQLSRTATSPEPETSVVVRAACVPIALEVDEARARDLLDLIDVVGASKDVPDGLAFWLRHLSRHDEEQGELTLAAAWAAMPRAEWMLWLAQRVGVSRILIANARDRIAMVQREHARARVWLADVKNHVHGEKLLTPISDEAEAVRGAIRGRDVATALGRMLGREGA